MSMASSLPKGVPMSSPKGMLVIQGLAAKVKALKNISQSQQQAPILLRRASSAVARGAVRSRERYAKRGVPVAPQWPSWRHT